jgi:hypothetical protein
MSHREKVFIDGKLAPSVTEVLAVVDKPFLKLWYGKLGLAAATAYLKETQELGRRFHSAIEEYFRGGEVPELDQREAGMFALFKGWAVESGFSPVDLELHVQSRLYGYHGTFDAIGKFAMSDELLICDWKTSSGIDALYGAQLAAYAQAYKEETGTEILNGLIVRIDKKSDAKKPIEIKRFTDLPKYFEVFKHCRHIHDFVNKRGEWQSE